jgi:2-hydroxychromene-2-carboxylate isomerase
MSSSDRRRRHARRLSRSERNTIMLPIDFYFDFASPYGFLAAMQIDALAERAGRTVRWRPFLLGAVYKQVEQSPLDHPPVPVGNLRSKILMVQSAQNRHRQRATDGLNGTRDRRVLVQR